MSRIHLAFASGSKAEYADEQVEAMWRQGKLDMDTQYWKEGMEDWRPIGELFNAAAPPPPRFTDPDTPSAIDSSPYTEAASYTAPSYGETERTYTFRKNPRTLTNFLVIMLWISLVLEVVSILSDGAQYSLLNRAYTEQEAIANDIRQGVVGLAYLVVFLVTAIAFLKWIYRANANARGFVQGMQYTSGWAVGYYFVPFINLFRPYQVMKEIWQVSHDPQHWRTQPCGGIVNLWWTLWIVSNVIANASFRISMNGADTIESLKISAVISIFSSFVGIPLCCVALTMIKTITAKQEELVFRR